MSKARDLANAGTALGAVSATELGYVDGVTSAIQTQIDTKEATLPSQTGNSGKYLTTNGTAKSWGTVSQYALPTQTGNSGKFLTTNGTAESWGSAGTTWTSRIASPSGNSFKQIAYNGSDTYVAVGDAGQLYSSTDSGVTWTSRTSGFGSNAINDVFYGNGLWVAVGDAGTLTTSTDSITWTARTANMSTNVINAVTYANSLWVAVGAGGGATNTGGIIYSSDGITWTRKSQTLGTGNTYNCVVWNGTNWVVGRNAGTNNYLYATTPSGTWTEDLTAGGNSVDAIYWDGTRLIFVNNTSFWYKAGTTLASAIQMTGAPGGSFSTGSAKYYSSSMYSYGIYIQSFVTASTVTPVLTAPIIPPTTRVISTSPYLSQGTGAILVTSQGTILGSSNGRLYTSF